jgi:chromosome segregation protein
MRLKQIKLAGFKSFVDATTVTLPGNRCAVVGPNGCGKSNIIDAVRWVMGESSAKQLRGENLTDVIFNGSTTRKPNSAASIELVFDNSDGRIGGEFSSYADIAIRREVSRDGQSNYLLNGNRCRRRDIQDIFLGTGFGPRSYSIIEQGMISQLVEAKPEELRVYLEEAAGISKYKERRRETENRIKHTRENLERINDIREELGRQLDRLQRQAQAAVRYRELKTEESLLSAQFFTLRYNGFAETLQTTQQKITDLELALEKAVAEQRHIEASVEEKRQLVSQQSEQANEIQEQFYQLGTEIARIEETLQFNQQRSQQLQVDFTGAEQRQTETQKQLAMDEQQISEMQQQLAELQPNLQSAQQQNQQDQEALGETEAQGSEVQQRWDKFLAVAAENEREIEAQSSRLEYLKQLVERLLTLRQRNEDAAQQAEQQPQEGGQLVEQLALQITDLESADRTLTQRIEDCLEKLTTAREQVVVRERALEEARGRVQELRHQLASLQAAQDAALGQDVQEAEAWIESQGLRQAQRVGEHLAVVPGWERAIEAILGRFMQAIQVDSISDYADALVGLAEGDVALVEYRDNLDQKSPRSAEFDLPTAASLVRSEAIAAGSLLYGVYAAQSIEVALANRSALSSGQSIITREGLWVGSDWMRVLHGGDQTQGIIERGQAIEQLLLNVEEAEQELATLQQQLQEQRSAIESLESQREALQLESNSLTQNLSERRTDHGVRQVKMEEAAARKEQLQKDTEQLNEQIREERNRLEKTEERLQEVQEIAGEHGEQRETLALEREQVNARLQQSREAADRSRDQFHQLNVQHQGLQSQLKVSLTARERLLNQQQDLQKQLHNIQQSIEQSSQPQPELQQQLTDKLATRVEVEGRLNAIRSEIAAIDESIQIQQVEREQVEAQVEQVRGGLEHARVERQGISVQEANVLEQLQSTGHDLAEVQEGLPEEANEQQWAEELERMGRRIQRLGAINLAAIEEYDQESERKQYLDAQAEDLELAMQTLLDAIAKIDRETRSRFKDTFEAVNSKLSELFPKVFGGGHAYLELTGDDMLDTGVSLMAQPPGKRNASVHLLSGGEKAMTAVALIFSIFHLNPSPVCLLDEVDAPLDDINVTRFAGLIKEMSESVQFLVITHNKITMEMADYLMGVTMQEAGVSRLVSVDVEAAAALAIL